MISSRTENRMRLPEQIVEELAKTQEGLSQLLTKKKQLIEELKGVSEYVNSALSGLD
jgi:hypothetical protein